MKANMQNQSFQTKKVTFFFAVSLKVTTSSMVFFLMGTQHSVGRFYEEQKPILQ